MKRVSSICGPHCPWVRPAASSPVYVDRRLGSHLAPGAPAPPLLTAPRDFICKQAPSWLVASPFSRAPRGSLSLPIFQRSHRALELVRFANPCGKRFGPEPGSSEAPGERDFYGQPEQVLFSSQASGRRRGASRSKPLRRSDAPRASATPRVCSAPGHGAGAGPGQTKGGVVIPIYRRGQSNDGAWPRRGSPISSSLRFRGRGPHAPGSLYKAPRWVRLSALGSPELTLVGRSLCSLFAPRRLATCDRSPPR